MSEFDQYPFNQLICQFTGKLYFEAFIANDGYIYERDYIETLYYGNSTFISPITGKEFKSGGVSYTKLNNYLEKFYKDHPELLEMRYISNNNIISKFRDMMNNNITSVDDIVSYVENHKEIKFVVDTDTYKKFISLLNNEKGLKFIIDDIIYCKSYPFYACGDNKAIFIIKNSDICVLAYDYIISVFKEEFFAIACVNGRYDLIVKLYNYNNNLIKYISSINSRINYVDNVFNYAIRSNNLDLLKFLHSCDSTLYKNTSNNGYTPFVYSCL